MKAPRHASASRPSALAPILACLLAAPAGAAAQGMPTAQQQQQTPRASAARGVELYRQGKLEEAADALRAAVKADKADAGSWHLLGVVLNSAGKAKEARKAFEAAVKLRPDRAESHEGLAYTLLVANKPKEAERAARRALELAPRGATARYTLGVVRLRQGRPDEAIAEADRVLGDAPDYAPAHRLRGQAHLDLYGEAAAEMIEESSKRKSPPAPSDPAARARRWGHLTEAARSFEKYLQLAPDASDSAMLREQLESLRVHASLPTNAAEPVAYPPGELTTRAVVLSRPEPEYTGIAREEGVEGRVILRLVLAADGQVKHIFVLRGLSHGLTEKAVAAARRIRFKPATKDGRPVSQFATIMYDFGIY